MCCRANVPKIEVTFDIDANGILNVSAKDQATGKSQSIVIKASSGLSDAEVARMVKDAEDHAAEDKKFRELVDVRNRADAQSHSAREYLDKASSVSDTDVQEIERTAAALDESVKGEDKESIEKQTQKLADLIRTAKEKESKKSGQNGAGKAGNQAADGDEVIDAEFEDASNNEAEAPH